MITFLYLVKQSRPYPLRDGDILQLGIDYQGRVEGFNFRVYRN